MKKFTALTLFLCAFLLGHSQEKGFTSAEWVQLGIAMNGSPDFKAVNVVLAPGYAFNHRWFVRLNAEGAIDLFKSKEVKTYRTNILLGATVGLNMVHNKYDLLDITVGAGNSLRTNVWNYTYFDAGIHWSMNNFRNKPMFGAGIRYYGSHDSQFDKYWNIYICIGVRFN